VKASHLSLVNFDSNRYSVPVEYGFSKLTLYAYAWHIEISCGDSIIATHNRCYDKGREIMEIDHYLPLLLQRPGAFPYARPVRQWKMPPVYRNCYDALCRKHEGYGAREFLQVLAMGRIYGKDAIERAMTQVLEENLVSSERIRQLVSGNAVISVQSTLNGYLGQVKVVLPDLNQFDRLRDMAAVGGSH
jgi:hypothetical protein